MPAPGRRLSATFRFAPSPNGRLHLGHAYSALLNADLARRAGGRLLLRIEDIDAVRSRPELIAGIEADLAWLGLAFDGPALRQSGRMAAYRAALDDLAMRGLAYPCFCSRAEVRARAGDARDPDGAPLYPGTCRALPAQEMAAGRPHAWRLDMARALNDIAPAVSKPGAGSSAGPLSRAGEGQGEGPAVSGEFSSLTPTLSRSGEGASRVSRASAGPGALAYDAFEPGGAVRSVPADPARWGDAVIGRRDVPTSYHLAVVIDDAAQAITHVVRGKDLKAATDLHVLLQALLGLPSPRYHHHGLILDADGRKLAKSRGSTALADLRAAGETAAGIRARLGFD